MGLLFAVGLTCISNSRKVLSTFRILACLGSNMNKRLKEHKALSPRYEGVPLRYEDSKPVQTQMHTHQNIIDIGQTIHVQWETQAENERDRAVSAAQHKVWQEAEHMKN